LFSPPCAATYIIVSRNFDQIVVGADSKVIRDIVHSNGKKEVIERTECKIKPLRQDLFISLDALGRQPASNYDAFIIAKQVATIKSGREVVPAFIESVKVPLVRAVAAIDRTTPGGFRTKYPFGLVLEVAIFGKTENSVFADRIRFFASSGGHNNISITSEILRCPGDCPNVGKLQLGGEEQLQESIWKDGQIEGVRRALAQAIKGHPAIVGPPISIIKITPKGVEWVEKGACK